MKKTLSIFLVCVALLIFANGVFATNLNSKIIPFSIYRNIPCFLFG